MLFKIILIFLLAMVLVGMVGKLLFPNVRPRLTRRGAKTCAGCGRPLIGKRCSCGKDA
ncbi:MAG: hypothetical protein IPL38_13545 [Rhodobacter sp.]|jgi:hypothetical protein|nr:hypothetical protein [Rhodobacter sp.]MBK8440459.1 hypothetical protein [Rhodobacter sp.]